MTQLRHPRLVANNFDLLRFLFAGAVCLVHVYVLSGFATLAPIAQTLSSTVAVRAFFVISGFLIFMSFEQSTSTPSYLRKRVRRIYPAYVVVVMLCATLLVFVSTKSPAEYFSLPWLKYVLANLVFLNFLQPTLPGVFESNQLTAVNGALWTLKIEAMFYLSVPAFVYLFRRFSRGLLLLLAYGLSVAYSAVMTRLASGLDTGMYAELGRQLPGQLSFFMAGAALYYYLPMFERHVKLLVPAAAVVLLVSAFQPLPLLYPAALAIVVVFFGLFLFVGHFGKYGDFSYGIYILHFPLIQLLVQLDWFRNRPWHLLAAVVILTLAGAVLLWHGVESRFLSRKQSAAAETSEGRRVASDRPTSRSTSTTP